MQIDEFNNLFKILQDEEKRNHKDMVVSTKKSDRIDNVTEINSELRKIGINPKWISLPIMKKSDDIKSPKWFSLSSINLNDDGDIISMSLIDLASTEHFIVPIEDFEKLIDYNEKQLKDNADLYYSVGDENGLRKGTKRQTKVEIITEDKIEKMLKKYQDDYVDNRVKETTVSKALKKYQSNEGKPLSKIMLLYIYIRALNTLKPTDDFVEYFKSHKQKLPFFMRDAIKYMLRIEYNNPKAQLVVKHHDGHLEFQYQDNDKAIKNFEKAPTSENL